MRDVFICDAVRTPIGRYAGALAKVRTDDLAAVPIKALMARNPKVDWSKLDEVYANVKSAVEGALAEQGTPPLVLCHISHVYETGASLYFTVAAKELEDGLAQWGRAKAAASQAMVDSGASITHHHAIGQDHKEWYAQEIGPVAVDVLRAVKQALDPAGVLNPGVLIP